MLHRTEAQPCGGCPAFGAPMTGRAECAVRAVPFVRAILMRNLCRRNGHLRDSHGLFRKSRHPATMQTVRIDMGASMCLDMCIYICIGMGVGMRTGRDKHWRYAQTHVRPMHIPVCIGMSLHVPM